MEELLDRIGIIFFVQLIIMTFNVIFILIMIISLLIDRRSDRTKNNIRVPLTEEIMVFYSATILYDLFDSGTILFTGITSPVGKIMIQITVFGYYAVGAFQTIFFLQVIQKHIAEKNGLKLLKKIIFAFQLFQIPCIVLLAATPFTDALYYFDEGNIYTRGAFYPVWYYTTIISFTFIIVVFIIFFKKTERFTRAVITICAIVPMISFLLNFTYTGISFNNISVFITSLLLFVMYEQRRAKETGKK